MAEVGRTVLNTIAKAPITFAMIELAEPEDCNARKSQWLRYGFKDVTPIFSGQSTVPSLNDSMVDPGRKMLKQMVDVAADWFMVSGHHGAIYQADYYTHVLPNGDLDNLAIVNGEEYCGFFNEAYHQGRWDTATRADPDSTLHPPAKIATFHANEIYLRTTDTAPDSIAKHIQDNPLFDSTSWAPEPKGIIISACNTLIYKSARKTWSAYFPKAVIIGTISRIVSGTWVTNAIASAKMTNESFWRDPQSILDQPGMCAQLEKQLTAGFPKSSDIGFIYKGTLYSRAGSQPAGDPLPPP
ncbi:MAG: hypothetical protein WB627_06820 [Candidatus Acidiferrum sp.]